jgi:hypothetical protein
MRGYLLGALMTSITLGLVIVFSLRARARPARPGNTLSPAVDIALGGLALLVAWILGTGRHERLAERRRAAGRPSRTRGRRDGSGSWQGVRADHVRDRALLTLPGASYLAGLDEIHKLNYSTTATVLLIVGFNVVMLWRSRLRSSASRSLRLDPARDRSRQGVGEPTRTRLRGAWIRRSRSTADHQGIVGLVAEPTATRAARGISPQCRCGLARWRVSLRAACV